MPQPPITKIHLKITYLKFHSDFPGANELMYLYYFVVLSFVVVIYWVVGGVLWPFQRLFSLKYSPLAAHITGRHHEIWDAISSSKSWPMSLINYMSSLKWGCCSFDRDVVILMKFSFLASPEVVKMTTSAEVSDENFIKMLVFPFQWSCYIGKCHWRGKTLGLYNVPYRSWIISVGLNNSRITSKYPCICSDCKQKLRLSSWRSRSLILAC